jgi:hypothetical protein
MTTLEDLEGIFDEHPSLNASLQDFEHESSEIAPSPQFNLYPSHLSGFRSEESDSDKENSLSGGGYSPPAWRRSKNGMRSSGFWRSSDNVLRKHARNERELSAEYESADDGADDTLEAAVRTRLPTGSLSPEKRRSPSPDPYPSGGGDFGSRFGGPSEPTPAPPTGENSNNCMTSFCITDSMR